MRRLKEFEPGVNLFRLFRHYTSMGVMWGDSDVIVRGLNYVQPLSDTEGMGITFCVSGDSETLAKSKAKMVFLPYYEGRSSSPKRPAIEPPSGVMYITCSARDVKALFAGFVREVLMEDYTPVFQHIEGTLGRQIGPNVHIEEGAEIGDDVVLEGNIYVHANVRIGDHVYVKANTVIGGAGFGFVKSRAGHQYPFPQIGNTIIEDYVMVGSNTCIDRGALGDTVLRRGCRVDNLVHIAHNVEIGENSLVIAGAMVAGSVKIGRGTTIAPQASIRNGLTVGHNCLVGMHSCVVKDVSDDTVVAGVPAREFPKK